MGLIRFDCIEEMAEEISSIMNSDDYVTDTIVVCNYKTSVDLINEMIREYGFGIGNVEIYSDEIIGYDEYYVISLDNEEMEIWCEPLHRDNKVVYFDTKGSFVLIQNGAAEDIFDEIELTDLCFSFVVKESQICDCEKCYGHCEKNRDENKKEIVTETNKNTIHQSWSDGNTYVSRSFMSTNEDDVMKIIKEWSDFADRFNNK